MMSPEMGCLERKARQTSVMQQTKMGLTILNILNTPRQYLSHYALARWFCLYYCMSSCYGAPCLIQPCKSSAPGQESWYTVDNFQYLLNDKNWFMTKDVCSLGKEIGRKARKKIKKINIYQVTIMCQKESQVLYFSELSLQLSYKVHIPIYREEAKARKSCFIHPTWTQLASSWARIRNLL